jgi:hypothetical protein
MFIILVKNRFYLYQIQQLDDWIEEQFHYLFTSKKMFCGEQILKMGDVEWVERAF